ncbi:hypothetical protein TELCIR_06547 [Teladorsagia circumcincta]|uniref:Uncharacterized protein n=1 Tax=Teladorsagia circumcincta TaxID=45464 RepID=A0A2G9UMP6_TELCI|nr:hypothetical protein TELCIR_06547 [Teladorsagia circumcincta]
MDDLAKFAMDERPHGSYYEGWLPKCCITRVHGLASDVGDFFTKQFNNVKDLFANNQSELEKNIQRVKDLLMAIKEKAKMLEPMANDAQKKTISEVNNYMQQSHIRNTETHQNKRNESFIGRPAYSGNDRTNRNWTKGKLFLLREPHVIPDREWISGYRPFIIRAGPGIPIPEEPLKSRSLKSEKVAPADPEVKRDGEAKFEQNKAKWQDMLNNIFEKGGLENVMKLMNLKSATQCTVMAALIAPVILAFTR